MSGHRIGRVAEDLKRELCDIMRNLKDPRVTELISVVQADVSNDLSWCTVYVSSMKGLEDAQNAVKGLVSAKGFIKKELSSRLKMRKTPELKFIADNSIEDSARILRMLNDVKTNEN